MFNVYSDQSVCLAITSWFKGIPLKLKERNITPKAWPETAVRGLPLT